MSRKFVGLLVVLLVLGCSFGVLAETPVKGGTLVFGAIGDASVINSVLAKSKTDGDYAAMVYESVVNIDRDTMEPVPGKITMKYESTTDNLVWTFYLKKGVTFSDGHELDAEDVKYTYEIMVDSKTNTVRKYLMDSVENIKVLDKYTVQFKLKYPAPDFLTSTMTVGILPAHLYKGTDINTNPVNQKPVGTGPFVLTEWVHDDHATFVAREDYHRGRVHIDKVIYKVVANANAVLAAAEAGDLDYANVPPKEVARMQKTAASKGLKFYSRWDFGYSYVGFNLVREPFTDVRVRKALAMALYKPSVIKVAYNGQGTPATSNVVPGINWAFNPNISDYEYNFDAAAKLLTEAGWVDTNDDGIRDKNGKKLSFTLLTNKGSSVREKTSQVVQSYWKKLGIDVKLDAYTWNTFMTEVFTNHNFDAVVLSWTNMGPDPDDYSLFHSSQIKSGFNFVSYNNPRVDELLVKGRTTMDLNVRKGIYHEIQQLIHDDYPYIFMMYTKGNAVFNEKIRGLHSNPLDNNYIKDWKDIYLVK